jgi:ribosomal protein S18 acetylase RimI-like enzyme
LTDIRRLGPGDEALVHAAAHLFDGPPLEDATRRFLDEPGHHLLLALEGSTPLGFVTGVETVHPDKGAEMYLYELSVDEPVRRRGIGRALVVALAELARERSCHGMWVPVDPDNEAARATYRSAGAAEESPAVAFAWTFQSR